MKLMIQAEKAETDFASDYAPVRALESSAILFSPCSNPNLWFSSVNKLLVRLDGN